MAQENPSGIAEIDELFAFLAEQNRTHAEIEHQYRKVSEDYAQARAEINRLSNRAKKDNADPDIYDQLEALVGSEARATILGHIQRGGTPTAHDRVLSSRYGYAAVEMAMRGEFGRIVALKGDVITSVSLEEVIGQKTKNVSPDHELVGVARAMGISFGD